MITNFILAHPQGHLDTTWARAKAAHNSNLGARICAQIGVTSTGVCLRWVCNGDPFWIVWTLSESGTKTRSHPFTPLLGSRS